MKLMVGLGNPGREYFFSRHNIGFMVVEALALKHNMSFNQLKHHSLLSRGQIAGEKVLLVKPLTYMNLSGRAVKDVLLSSRELFLESLVIVHDDMDLELGRIRFKVKGGSGGHRGVDSIIEKLNTRDFVRLKIGIGRPQNNGNPEDDGAGVRNYVLEGFSSQEEPLLKEVIKKAAEALEILLLEGIDTAMNRYNC
ncbi:aminoacyl-tRNA hydrolase [Candidatus Contubernalis alkaliaceticus]|uniref:aminoacyl-tRNA hydrolase n=1 Tax=Candidatus Contubernalis alkaliaceticus TaxID=338645 RepID=UPI001F4BF4EE|nr:aminoacyl-tRNA hydrolase [Candidatus Contubernalis alkalaceticus]UNC90700.1 aminoacyl-tRNA hydrolase [Candidatus Contubernalis alkalaceticus]